MSGRIRWEPGEDGILFGYSGTLKPWVFAICPPGAPGDFWMISTSFPLGQPRYVGSEKEARDAAERWLTEFTASIGAVFLDEPAIMFADVTEAALKLAGDWDAESDRLDDLADKPGTDEDARPVLSGEAQGYSDCADALREAITAALTGKEAGGGI